MQQYLLECCVDSVESALAAARGGADRLELCASLILGGTSPGLALFEQVRAHCSLPVRVLLRPRFGDFLYSDYEFLILQREVEQFRSAGAEGIVIGCLDRDGGIDLAQMERLIELAGGMKVTLHRAFDVCKDPMQAYKQAKALGIDTILTSGQKSSCMEGLELLKELSALQRQTGGPQIMAGAGMTPERITVFCRETDITAYHLSAKKLMDSGMRYRKEGVPMGLPVMSEYSILRTDEEIVAQARRKLDLESSLQTRTGH